MKERKSRGGRPRREPDPGERVKLGLRVTPETKQLLDEAAERSGRSQSQEAEFRLERSFDRSQLLPEVLSLTYGRRLAGLLMTLGLVMSTAAALAGRDPLRRDDWVDEYSSYFAAVRAANAVLDLWDPQELDATDVSPEETVMRTDLRGMQAVELLITVLTKWSDTSGKNPVGRDMGFDLIAPMVAGMISEFPEMKERRRKVSEMLDAMDRKQAMNKVIVLGRKAS